MSIEPRLKRLGKLTSTNEVKDKVERIRDYTLVIFPTSPRYNVCVGLSATPGALRQTTHDSCPQGPLSLLEKTIMLMLI